MSTDLIPAGDRGHHTITRAQFERAEYGDLKAFRAQLVAEARRRGLEVSVTYDHLAGFKFEWRPDPTVLR